eukprot:m.111540 g.111540  ORF g.111540 m.111540 type:complete len:53 (-) comp12764_c8_seq4:7-165(-)
MNTITHFHTTYTFFQKISSAFSSSSKKQQQREQQKSSLLLFQKIPMEGAGTS